MSLSSSQPLVANLIIAGVNKAGSTSLFYYLASHPDVCGSKDKETCYFLPLLYDEPVADISNYEDQFTHCSGSKYRLEATPAYIYGGELIARRIYDTLKPVKIIIILKDPVDRLISFYNRKKATFQLPGNMDLRTYVDVCISKTPGELALKENQIYTGIALGQYDEYLEPWLRVFGDNIKIVFFDDLKKHAGSFMHSLAKWLQIDPGFYNTFEFDIKNQSHNYKYRFLHKIAVNANNTGRRLWRSNPALKKLILDTYYRVNGKPVNKSDIPEDVVEQLREHFEKHNKNLTRLLSAHGYKNVPQWLSQAKETA